MKAVKLADLKVGDQVCDIPTNFMGNQTLLEVEKKTTSSVYFKVVSGNPYPNKEIRFSLFGGSEFYKP